MAKIPTLAKPRLGAAQSVAVFEDEKTMWELVAAALDQKPCPLVRIAMREFAEKYKRKHKVDLSGLPPFLRFDA